MHVYLMARYSRRQEMLIVAADLEKLGHTVTSRWIRGGHELQDAPFNADPHYRQQEAARFAREDIADMDWCLRQSSDKCFIAFTEEPNAPYNRGGRHVEAGIALAWALDTAQQELPRLILVGPRENVFYCLPVWEHYPDWPACRAALAINTDAFGRKHISVPTLVPSPDPKELRESVLPLARQAVDDNAANLHRLTRQLEDAYGQLRRLREERQNLARLIVLEELLDESIASETRFLAEQIMARLDPSDPSDPMR